MELFHRMAYVAAANLLGASAESRITNEQLSEELERIALSDPDLIEYYAGMTVAVPAVQIQRALEDAEVGSAQRGSRGNSRAA